MPPSEFNQASTSVRNHRARGPLLATLIVAMLGLAACGSSSKPKPKTTAVAATQTTTGPATASTATTSTATTAHKRPGKVPAHGKSGSGSGSGTHTGATTVQLHPTPPPVTTNTVTPGPAALACLRQAGLHHVRKGTEPGVDIGNAGNTSVTDVNGMVFVDGPYKTVGKADASAQSLLGTEYAARGGLFVVSATLRSHLNATVHTVAGCLQGKPAGSGKGAGKHSGKSFTF